MSKVIPQQSTESYLIALIIVTSFFLLNLLKLNFFIRQENYRNVKRLFSKQFSMIFSCSSSSYKLWICTFHCAHVAKWWSVAVGTINWYYNKELAPGPISATEEKRNRLPLHYQSRLADHLPASFSGLLIFSFS